jgi:hypothetical protein
MNEAEIQRIQNELARYFTLGCTVRWTSAGLLISAIRDNTTLNEAKNQTLDLIGQDLVDQNEIVYRLFVYSSPEQQFKTEATLYTKGSDYRDGMHTSYRQTTDADIYMREIDYEFLCLAGRPNFSIEAKNHGTTNPMINGQRYEELFVMGMSYRNVTTHLDAGRWLLSFN